MDDAAATKQAYQTFSYKKPENLRRGKGIVELAKSKLIRGRVQIIGEGVRTTCIPTRAWTGSGWCCPAR